MRFTKLSEEDAIFSHTLTSHMQSLFVGGFDNLSIIKEATSAILGDVLIQLEEKGKISHVEYLTDLSNHISQYIQMKKLSTTTKQ